MLLSGVGVQIMLDMSAEKLCSKSAAGATTGPGVKSLLWHWCLRSSPAPTQAPFMVHKTPSDVASVKHWGTSWWTGLLRWPPSRTFPALPSTWLWVAWTNNTALRTIGKAVLLTHNKYKNMWPYSDERGRLCLSLRHHTAGLQGGAAVVISAGEDKRSPF